MVSVVDEFMHSDQLLSRPEISAKPCPIPAAAGVCGWWFDRIPDGVPAKTVRYVTARRCSKSASHERLCRCAARVVDLAGSSPTQPGDAERLHLLDRRGRHLEPNALDRRTEVTNLCGALAAILPGLTQIRCFGFNSPVGCHRTRSGGLTQCPRMHTAFR